MSLVATQEQVDAGMYKTTSQPWSAEETEAIRLHGVDPQDIRDGKWKSWDAVPEKGTDEPKEISEYSIKEIQELLTAVGKYPDAETEKTIKKKDQWVAFAEEALKSNQTDLLDPEATGTADDAE